MANIAKTFRGSERPPPPVDRPTRKSQKKRGASDDGDAARKSPKRTGAEGDDDKKKDADTNGAPVDSEHLTETELKGNDNKNEDARNNGAPEDCKPLTATDGPDTSSTKHDGPTTPHNHDADPNPETNEQKDAGTDSHLIFETPDRNTTVSKNGFFRFGKTRLSNITIIFHDSSSYTRNPYFHGGYYQPPKVARNSSKRAA